MGGFWFYIECKDKIPHLFKAWCQSAAANDGMIIIFDRF